jgi:alpha-ribazole phosphatase
VARLILVRHGDTVAGSRQRYWGRTDVALSDDGLYQAECAAARLAAEPLVAIYASDLVRAARSAEIIAAPHGLPVTACPELREIDFGEIEGLTFGEAEVKFPEVTRRWAAREPNLAFPGGEDVDTFSRRVGAFTARLGGHGEGDTLAVVAHSGTLRNLTTQLMGLADGHRWQFRLDLAAICILQTFDGGAVMELWNDRHHLDGSGKAAGSMVE